MDPLDLPTEICLNLLQSTFTFHLETISFFHDFIVVEIVELLWPGMDHSWSYIHQVLAV